MAMAPGSPLSQLPLPPQKLEINTLSPVIIGINSLRKSDEKLAKLVAEQVMDNALIAAGRFQVLKASLLSQADIDTFAGLLDDARSMTRRLNSILEKLVAAQVTATQAEAEKKE